jgi:diamine N-acetyltransferase
MTNVLPMTETLPVKAARSMTVLPLTTVLRAVRDEDLPVLTAMRNDVELQLELMARPRPNSPRQVAEWINRRSSDETGAFFIIATFCDDEAVGFTQLQRIDPVNGHAWLGIAVAAEQRGAGYGRQALAQLEDYAVRVLDLGKLMLEVRSDNHGAMSLYRALGYRTVGTLTNHFRSHAQSHDVVIMERLLR